MKPAHSVCPSTPKVIKVSFDAIFSHELESKNFPRPFFKRGKEFLRKLKNKINSFLKNKP